MSETQEAASGNNDDSVDGGSTRTIIEAQKKFKTSGRKPESKKLGKGEIFEQAQLLNAFSSSFELFEEDYQNSNLTPEERWAYESIKTAKEKTIDKGKSAFTNKFQNLETGETYTQEEGIPIENLLEFLGKRIESLPADSTQREKLLRLGHILYINSQPFSLLPHHMETERRLGRTRQEALFVSKDVRATGSDFDNWIKADRALMARLELVLPLPEVKPAAAPAPEERPVVETRPEVTPSARAEVAPAPKPAAEATARPTETAPVATVETVIPRVEPQSQTIKQVRRELTIANRTIDIEKRARELAEQQLREEMRRGSGWNPLNWPRKIGLRMAEDYHRQLYTERARQAMLAANNSYLTMDVVRNAAINATHGAAEAQAAGKAKIEQAKTGVSLEGQQVIEVAGELKTAILSEIIHPVIDGQITTEGEIQQKLREFVQSHQNDPQVKEVFGRDTTLYGRLAEYFATDLLEMGKLVREDIALHKYSVEQLDKFTKIRIANTSWAAETQASFNRWSDRAVRWAQQGRIRGAILNPATVGALASVTTFLALRAPGGVAKTIAPFAAPGVGVLAGAAFAAFRRNYDLKVDRASQQVEGTYNMSIPQQGAPRREALERFAYNTASVNELINGGGQELLTGTTRKSLVELLSADLSDGQNSNRENVIRRIAEIKTRLDFSSREKVDLVTFEAREKVEHGRLALTKAIVKMRQALGTAGMSDTEKDFIGKWNSRFTKNREQQDRSFTHYRLRNAVGAAVFGGAAGAVGGLVSQEGFTQIARHFPEAANIPVIGGLFQKGETLREQVMREHGLKLPGIPQTPTAPEVPVTSPYVPIKEHLTLLKPEDGKISAEIPGQKTLTKTLIPKGAEWVQDSTDSNKWDLRVAGTDKVLLNDAQFNSSGQLANYDRAASRVDLFDLENKAQPPEILTGQRATDEWGKLKTDIHHREWYAYDRPGAQRNELRLYTHKDGDTVVLDMSKMEQGFQKGLTPNPINVQEIIKTQKSGFMFSIPGPDGKLVSAWIPDGADGAWDGKLRLDPNSMREITVGGKTMTLGEFSKMVVNQNALKPLSNGDIATELYNRQNVFKLGLGGKNGFIEAGTLVPDRPEGKVLQAFATIRGNGEVQVELPKGFIPEITLKGPWTEEIPKLAPAPEVPQPQPIEGEAPSIIPIPFAPRHPLERLKKGEVIPQPPPLREPERETPLRAEQTTADQTLADQLTAARDELAGLQQGLAATRRHGIEPNLEQQATLKRLQAEVERLQQEAAAPAPAPGPQPLPQVVPPAPVGPAAQPVVEPTGPAAPPPTETSEAVAARRRLEKIQETIRSTKRQGFDPTEEQKTEVERLQKELGLAPELPEETSAETQAQIMVTPSPAPTQPPPQPPKVTLGQRLAGIFGRKRAQPPPSPTETLEATEKKLASSINQLPPLKEGFVRLVHLTHPNFAKEIVETGLDYSKQGMIDSTARAYGDASQTEYSSQDPRFNYPDVKAVILDIPEGQYRLYRNVSDPNNPGKVPAEYVVGVIDAYKPPPTETVEATEKTPVEVPAPITTEAPSAEPAPDETAILEATQTIAQPPAPTPPPQRGEPLSLEDTQRLKMWVEEIQTEKDLVKGGSMVRTLSRYLQSDPQESPQPLKLEEAKALITEELLKLDEEELLNLLQKYNSLQEALIMLRDRDIPQIRDASVVLKALRSQANAQKILRLLDQKQPPEFLSTRPQPPAQTPTGPLLTEKEMEALERTRDELKTMGNPPPPSPATEAPIAPLTKEETDALLADFPLDEGSETEAPFFPNYIEETGEKLGLTVEEKKALADTLKKDYFEDPIFKERVTLIEQDRLKGILERVIHRWNTIKPFEEADREELSNIGAMLDRIMPEQVDEFRTRLTWKLFYVSDKDINQFTPGEIQAFIRAIEIMGKTQSLIDKENE